MRELGRRIASIRRSFCQLYCTTQPQFLPFLGAGVIFIERSGSVPRKANREGANVHLAVHNGSTDFGTNGLVVELIGVLFVRHGEEGN